MRVDRHWHLTNRIFLSFPLFRQVHKMMKDSQNVYDLYNPLPEHTITHVLSTPSGHRVSVQHLTTGETKELDVSYCAILIGSRPDLRFLSHIVPSAPNNATATTTTTTAAVDNCKENRSPNLDELIAGEIERNSAAAADTKAAGDGGQLQQQQQWSLVGKKIAWLKNLCAKCRHLNLCEWSRRSDNYKRNCCRQNHLKYCECGNRNRMSASNQLLNVSTKSITTGNSNNNNNNIIHNNNNNNNSADDAMKTALSKMNTDNEHISFIGLGEDEQKPIDCKTNPVAVDKFTNEMVRTPKGLYSMGPLVGDNFIRFIPGGALAITAALHKEND